MQNSESENGHGTRIIETRRGSTIRSVITGTANSRDFHIKKAKQPDKRSKKKEIS
ncbi:MAG: hypothetical protein HQK62_08175 [Desulfamplus sp.]|nr:hypothetical protein [Desulfamplus sp.]